ncbi:MAG: FG-GAP-like repeat-containing protein [Archangium sp.]|nr:FG-GAP-like repeat-containing protein [Archangium sp.]
MKTSSLVSRLAGPLVALALCAAPPAAAQRLVGFADTHSHPMSHLGFGGMVMYGSPDPSLPMLAGQKYRGYDVFNPECNPSTEIAGSAAGALGNCNALHGAPGVGNDCGDVLRSAIVDQVEERYVFETPNPGLFGAVMDHPHAGYPGFAHWPHWSTVTHQQMYWEWVRRAWQGGQRVLVALAVNNSLLARAGNARQYIDDRASVDVQLDNISAFVGAHPDFMAIARTPQELRDIVNRGDLAVVLGVETDDFGNLTRRQAAGETITDPIIAEEIRHLWEDKGVRYILPIHFSDTVLGGYAINKDLFALSSKEYRNEFPTPRNSCGEGVHFELNRTVFNSVQSDLLRTRDLGRIIDTQPTYTPPSEGCGHANSRDLQPIGARALSMMMARGMLIDIDHMSRLTADEALQLAYNRDYPLTSGHNGMLDPACLTSSPVDPDRCNENARTRAQYERIRTIKGMVGMGHGGGSTKFVRSYRDLLTVMGNRPMAIGTDANGLEALPAPDPLAPVTYDASFPRYTFDGTPFDFNVVGFAHYGMFPDFLRSLQSSPTPSLRMTTPEMSTFLSSAEQFARTWERSTLRAVGAPRLTAATVSTVWCTHSTVTGVLAGDFNGDGADDLLCRDPSRLWFSYANNRGEITGGDHWRLDTTWCTEPGSTLQTGDFDGDGRSDLLCRDSGRIRIDWADRFGHFAGATDTGSTGWCPAGATLLVGDFNGDGRSDLMCRDGASNRIDFASNTGRLSGSTEASSSLWCGSSSTLSLGDVNGDGRTDLLCRTASGLFADHASTTPSTTFWGSDWSVSTAYCTHAGARPAFADVNGDGRVDWLCKDATRIWVDFADANGRYPGAPWERALTFCTGAGDTFSISDVNGDSRADLVCKNATTVNVRYSLLTGRY